MEIRRFFHAADLSALAGPWERLAGQVPLRGPEWAAAWWRHYGACDPGAELFVLTVHEGGRLAGLAPLFVQQSVWSGRALRLIGSGEAYTDYLGLLCEPGREAAVGRAVGRWLAGPGSEAFDVAIFDGVLEGDEGTGELMRTLEELGCHLTRRPGPSIWRLDLPRTWEDYLVGRSSAHRGELRRLQRRHLDSGEVILRTAATAQDVEHGLRWLRALHQARRTLKGDLGSFSSARFTAFQEEVARRLAAKGQLRLQWIERAGRPVGVLCDFTSEAVIYGYLSGIDHHAGLAVPGKLLFVAALRDAIEKGYRAYDFLRGDEPYKAHWRASPRATWDYRVVPDRIRARVRAGTFEAMRGIKRAALRTP